jgi:hypothetical protein
MQNPVLPVLAAFTLLLTTPCSPFQTQHMELTTGSITRENLEYEVEWRLISAGKARLTLSQAPPKSQSKREMKMHLESTGLVSRLFRVNDDYTATATENYCAENTFLAAHEGNREKETKVDFDASAHKAFYREHDLIKNTNIVHEVPIPDCSHDVISGLFELRALALEPGKTIYIPVSDGKKSVNMKIECQRREEIKTPMGPKKTLLYEVFAFNDVLYRRPGHIHIWLTDDERRVPVQIEIRLQFTIGTVTLRLAKDGTS